MALSPEDRAKMDAWVAAFQSLKDQQVGVQDVLVRNMGHDSHGRPYGVIADIESIMPQVEGLISDMSPVWGDLDDA